MTDRVAKADLRDDLQALGIRAGDVVLIRAALRAVGRVRSADFVEALLDTVGPEGTIVSLAFTHGTWLRRPRVENAFRRESATYAGALPTAMLRHPGAIRSRHPIASFVAIGHDARAILQNHGPQSPSYEPIREIVNRRGRCVLVGCVATSPGFTTTHLAETDLGHLRRVVMPWLTSTYYIDEFGKSVLYRCKDVGLCSQSFWKFYGPYVRAGILSTGKVGEAYSIAAPAADSYRVEREMLSENPQFNVCGSPDCFMCNAGRWDRIHRLPMFLARRVLQRAGLVHRISASAVAGDP
jgi:aminoglycoside N3'-acetyltransferase